jgi:hypothetical protein
MSAPKTLPTPAVPAKIAPPPAPVAPGQQKIIAPLPPKVAPTPVGIAPPSSASSQTLTQYVLSGMNLSMKACVEGQGSVSSLLQKACSLPNMSTEEMQFCAALPSVLQSMDGTDLTASICAVQSAPLSKVCETLPADQKQTCLALFQ